MPTANSLMSLAALVATAVTVSPAEAAGANGWKGCYVGAHLGWAHANSSVEDELYGSGPFAGLTAWNPPGEIYDLSDDSVAGGGQLGCDTQIVSAGTTVVLGAVIDATALDASARKNSALSADTSAGFSADFVSTLRARAGIPSETYLFYVTGGLALANLSVDASDLQSASNFGQMSVSETNLELGWTVGAGIEFKLAPQWTFGVEYLHMDFGSVTATGEALNIPGAFPTFSGDLKIDTVRATINWRL